jgi:hypothetical protein
VNRTADVPSTVLDKDMYNRSGLAHKYGAFNPPKLDVDRMNPIKNTDFLDLRGDLYWLQPIENNQEFHIESQKETDAITTGMTSLKIAATRLELTLPEPFIRFMADPDLRRNIPFCGSLDWYTVGPLMKLVVRGSSWKLSAMKDKSFEARHTHEGYVIKLLQESGRARLRNRWYLYLDFTGANCILDGLVNWGEKFEDTNVERAKLTPLEQELGITPLPLNEMHHVTVSGFTFEDFLAKQYFGNWTESLLWDEDIDSTNGRVEGSEPQENDSKFGTGDSYVCGVKVGDRIVNVHHLGSSVSRENELSDDEYEAEDADKPVRLPRNLKKFLVNLYTEQGRTSWRSRSLMRNLYRE